MPNYEEIIKQSQENVEKLSEKLKDLDKLHQDIISLKTKSEGIPLAFEQNFLKISELSKTYTETLGIASKTYLDGSNTLFTAKLQDLSEKNKQLEREISRLVNTDLTKLFNDLQKVFIEQAQKDLEIELKKIDAKTKDFQSKIDVLKTQVDRLTAIDLEKEFAKLQETLAAIFGAINAINLTLTNVVQTLTSIVQTLGNIETKIDTNHKIATEQIASFSSITEKHLSAIESKMNLLSEENKLLKKEFQTNKILQIVGLVITISLLIYLIMKH